MYRKSTRDRKSTVERR